MSSACRAYTVLNCADRFHESGLCTVLKDACENPSWTPFDADRYIQLGMGGNPEEYAPITSELPDASGTWPTYW